MEGAGPIDAVPSLFPRQGSRDMARVCEYLSYSPVRWTFTLQQLVTSVYKTTFPSGTRYGYHARSASIMSDQDLLRTAYDCPIFLP